MKKLFSIILVCSVALLLTTPAWAQQCFGVAIKEGSGFEMTNFNAKGKPDGTIRYRFKEVRQEGANTEIDVEMESLSAKGKAQYSQKFTMKCSGDEISVDAASLVMEEQIKTFESFDMTLTSNDIVYPNRLSVGQTLKDASLNGTGNMTGIPVEFEMNITDRKVVAQEKLKVGAGDFDTYKITSSNKMRTKTVIAVNLEFETVSYRAPGVLWDIRSETYRKGKLLGSTELTKIY